MTLTLIDTGSHSDLFREYCLNKSCLPFLVTFLKLLRGRNNLENNDRMEKDFEVLRSPLKNIEIVLYDEMYDRLKNLRISSLKTEEK